MASRRLLLSVFAVVGILALITWQHRGRLIVPLGGAVWLPVFTTNPLMPTSLQLALRTPIPAARAGSFEWLQLEPGLAVTEVPVLADGVEVDRLLMTRIDSNLFRISIENDPSGGRTIAQWMRTTGAKAVVNGSYYARDGRPAVPTISHGSAIGPTAYEATHGAFISKDGKSFIADLVNKKWQIEFQGAEQAMVSYPLLIDSSGSSRVTSQSGWLANRSFIAQMGDGQIVLGTTKDAFFTLDRLAQFLKSSPLDLAIALNLDGGPVACQAVTAGDYRRQSCGRWEVQVKDGRAWMLPPLWFLTDPPMPIAIVVRSKA